MVSPVTITNTFNGDISAANYVNAAALDTQLTNLATTINSEIAERQRTVRDGFGLASQVVRFPSLHPEVTAAITAGGLIPKQATAVVSTANVGSLSGLLTIDGYTLLANDRVLLVGQASAINNGLWVAAAGAWTRPSDSANAAVLPIYSFVTVIYGTSQAGSAWYLSAASTVNLTAQNWLIYSSGGILPIVGGGTGASDAATARTNLGLGSLAVLSSVTQAQLASDVQYRVDTIAALKALTVTYNSVLVLGYYAAGDGGGGTFRWNSADATADNTGTVIIPNSAPGVGRWNRVIDQLLGYNVKWFGAKGDGVAVDTVAIQATVTLATSTSGCVQFPHGVYLINAAIVIDLSAVVLDPINGSRTRIAFIGEGSGSTTIKSTHLGKAIDYRGGVGEGLSAFFYWRGLSLLGPNRSAGSVGLAIAKMSYFCFEDFDIALYEYGIDATDILSGSFNNGEIRLNQFGYRLAYSSQSRPNAIAFRDVRVAGNYTYGGLATGANCLLHDGGTVEGNGIGLSLANPSGWGIKVVDCGIEGVVGLVVKGTYFEGTNGYADVWISQSTTPVQHHIQGSFLRYISTQYATYNVAFDRFGGGAGSRVRVSGGFKSLGTYVESVARPYLGGGISFFDVEPGTYFGSATATDTSSWSPTVQPSIPISFLPSAASWTGGHVFCTDLGGGGDLVNSNGAVWKRVNENSLVTIATDADYTVTVLTDAVHQVHSGTLTALRTVTLSTTRAYSGARFKFSRNGAGAFNLAIGAIKNLASNTWCEITYNGSVWVLTGYGAL